MDAYKKKLCHFDFSVNTGGDFPIFGDFDKYYTAVLTFEWDSLSAADGAIGFLERPNNTTTWKEVLSYTMVDATGSQSLQHGDYGENKIGYRITKGSVVSGTLTVYITAKAD